MAKDIRDTPAWNKWVTSKEGSWEDLETLIAKNKKADLVETIFNIIKGC